MAAASDRRSARSREDRWTIEANGGASSPVNRLATRCYSCYDAWVRTITQRQLRNESAAILRDVQSGQRMIVTRNGTPVAELRPVSSRRFLPRSAIAEAAATAPRIDAGRFRADLDAFVDQGVDV